MELNFKTDIKNWLENLEPLHPQTTGFEPRLNKKGTDNQKIKAVIFDIYGTLLISSSGDVDQAYLSAQNMEKALRAGGYQLIKNPLDAAEFIIHLLPEKIKTNHAELKQKGHSYPEIDIFSVWNSMLEDAQHKGFLEKLFRMNG